jgi:uncharacterized protein involved in propanediol utilization
VRAGDEAVLTRRAAPGARAGAGAAPGHHGEILQGAFDIGDSGPPCHGLVTLPCRRFASQATYVPSAAALTVTPAWKCKARRAAALVLAGLRLPVTGALEISATAPVARGLGSSTSDVLAAIRAVADAFGLTIPPADCAVLAVAAEGASDPVMFGDVPILFAQRRGLVLAELAARLPAFELVSVDITALRGVVHTDEQVLPDYGPAQVREFGELLAALRAALAAGDVAGLAAVATRSALINAAVYQWDSSPVELIAGESGALGWQLAHSGSVAGLIFPAGDAAADRAIETAGRAGFAGAWRYRAGAG